MEPSVTPLESKSSETPDTRKVITDWVFEARRVLMQLGVHVKNLIGEAQKLASAAVKARNATQNCYETSTVMIKAVQQAEKLLEDPQLNVYALKEFMADMKMYVEKSGLDAEIAQSSLEEVFQAASDIDEHINKTTQTMLLEAKMMQELKGKANVPS
jgi:predicted double-glycine peptidase